MSVLESRKLDLLDQELQLKKLELELNIKMSQNNAWRSPLVVAIFAAAVGALGNAWVTYFSAQNSQVASQKEFERTIILESAATENERILEMIKIGEPSQVRDNLEFLVASKLISNPETIENILDYYAEKPTNVGPGRTSFATQQHSKTSKLFSPGAVIRYAYLTTPSDREREVIERVINEWTTGINLSLKLTDNLEISDIRISLEKNGRSWSFVGADALRVQKDKPTIQLGVSLEEEDNFDRVLHEFGHALGMVHEHFNQRNGIRWDVAALMSFYSKPPYNLSSARITRNFLNIGTNYPCSRDFDQNSIMMYRIPSEVTVDRIAIAPKPGMADSDKHCIQEMYPFGDHEMPVAK